MDQACRDDLDKCKVDLHDGLLVDSCRLCGVHIHVDLAIPVVDVHDGILIGIGLLQDVDMCFDRIAFFQLVFDINIDIYVLIELDILVHFDCAARWSVADSHVDSRVLFDLDRVPQENVHMEHTVDVEDFEVDLDLLIDTHFLIEQDREVSFAVDGEGNVHVLVHRKVLVYVQARDHLAHIAADHDACVLVNDRDLRHINAVGVVDLGQVAIARTRVDHITRVIAAWLNLVIVPALAIVPVLAIASVLPIMLVLAMVMAAGTFAVGGRRRLGAREILSH